MVCCIHAIQKFLLSIKLYSPVNVSSKCMYKGAMSLIMGWFFLNVGMPMKMPAHTIQVAAAGPPYSDQTLPGIWNGDSVHNT